jgi:hypothetical protein
VYDLFAEGSERSALQIREHTTDGFFLEGCKMVTCTSYELACNAVSYAMQNRQIGSHEMNARSSRSHCITDIFIDVPSQAIAKKSDAQSSSAAVGSRKETPSHQHQQDIEKGKEKEKETQREYTIMGKMTLVDLAGSERLKSTQSTGQVLHDAGFINRSLYVLGKVIAGIVRTGGDLNHKDVPYRDSKLTKLLINSLGKKSRTLLIACVTEASGSQAETLRTLKFR